MRQWMRGLALAVGIGLAGAVFSVSPFGLDWEEGLGLAWLFRLRGPLPSPSEVAVVALDERSAIELGLSNTPRDWPRSLHGSLVDALVARDVDVIAFDLAFNRPQTSAEDAAFAAAIARARRVLLFQTIERHRQAVDGGGEAIVETVRQPVAPLVAAAVGVAPWLLPNVPARVSRFWAFLGQSEDRMSLPALALLAQAIRHDPAWRGVFANRPGASPVPPPHAMPAAAAPRLDEEARWLRQALTSGRRSLAHLPAATSESNGKSTPTPRLRRALLALFAGPDAYYLNFYGPPGTIRHIPYASLLDGADNAEIRDLAGRVVFVGYSELAKPPDFTRDAFITVFASERGVYLSGAEIAATAYANLLTGSWVKPLPGLAMLALVFGLGGVFAVAAVRLPPATAVPATLLLAAAYFGLAALVFARADLWLPLATPLLAQLPLALITGSGGQLLAARRRERALSLAKAEADEASQVKSEALRMAGHDIRTPVQAIIGYLEQIETTALDANQRHLVERVITASDMLLDLVNGVLDLAAIEAGKLRIVSEPVDLRRLLPSLIEMLQAQASAKRLGLSCVVDEAVPPVVHSDPLRLRQILANLLTNAIKFTDHGEVVLAVRIDRQQPARPLVLAIRDTGIGIEPEALAGLFEPFRRVGRGAVQRPGTGLGLSLSRRLARMMGGDISVDSRPGVGSTFRLHLPLAVAPAPTVAAIGGADAASRPRLVWPPASPGSGAGLAEGGPPPPPLAPYAVVIVEDDAQIRALLECQLVDLGFAVTAFAAGGDAWQHLIGAPAPRLLITDYHLPGLDGPALIAQVRSHPLLARLPVFALTADLAVAAIARLQDAGADAVLTKPVSGADLAATLRRIGLGGAADATAEPAVTCTPVAPAEDDLTDADWPVFDPTHVFQALGDNHQRVADILKAYTRQAGPQLTMLADAVDNRDNATVCRVAHQLTGTSLSFGVVRLGEICRRLERLAAAGDWPAVVTTVAAARRGLDAAEVAITALITDLTCRPAEREAQSSTSL